MRALTIIVGIFLLLMPGRSQDKPAKPAAPFVLVIHGGAGVVTTELTPEREAAVRATLEQALRAGHAVLEKGGASLDAVIAAIKILEDSPLFNAGKGAVLTAEGTVEMDASVMDGATRKAGAVAGVKHVKNPIELARMVMEKTPHVLLAGEGAEVVAKQHGLPLMPPDYFITEPRRQQLKRVQEQEKSGKKKAQHETNAERTGTVGAVALDQHGNLAAGTSTGGMVNKKFGRVGDSPIIGAGNYADNRTCAVSGTGHGEFFIRSVVAYDIAALMEYKGLSLAAAADEVVMKKLKALGGSGGVIAVDGKGNIAMPFNSEGMYRGVIRADGRPTIAIRKE
ncbi:MAG: isoaspartyl peptidase/L-asparaginase [Verrucomicrobia bacterium]|nr:isoaspartyl peptidase/L-asparaginase [Verrucomicrobiota bacterium]